ncbi:hypothetical protein C1752_02392 [Acaryochloris thomasi RCC1774]|uniref:Uncharacterized protein n=1 Tax=Acaryochloris thomasi RCC1774 TaxID=1764569 RepID=A0A2W1JIW5_9CYAN|nr:hypothetical protein [Acaryochloris thomasi]PZD73378.1 hypothetical protein C1752_02392 [Acaryochloris thomasi RCC1774]
MLLSHSKRIYRLLLRWYEGQRSTLKHLAFFGLLLIFLWGGNAAVVSGQPADD